MPSEPRLRLNLWSGPRNVSTALMYAFAQREDTVVVDEPLYAHYLRVSGALHPMRDDVLATMDDDGERVVREVLLGPCAQPVLFVKNMAHHPVALDRGFLARMTHVFLIRDPAEMLPSLDRHLPHPTLPDTGLVQQVELLEHLLRLGQDPPVLDARELLSNPPGVLRRLCLDVGLVFDEAMLHWPEGPRPEDGIWAPRWYRVVHRSTGFAPYRPRATPFPAHLEALREACRPYYERLFGRAIRADAVA